MDKALGERTMHLLRIYNYVMLIGHLLTNISCVRIRRTKRVPAAAAAAASADHDAFLDVFRHELLSISIANNLNDVTLQEHSLVQIMRINVPGKRLRSAMALLTFHIASSSPAVV
jgi:hypothetical protein